MLICISAAANPRFVRSQYFVVAFVKSVKNDDKDERHQVNHGLIVNFATVDNVC